jgi:acid phosphatase
MENTSNSSIIGNAAQAPYINSLAVQNSYSSNHFAVTHPSLPNYLALTGASTFGITSDCSPAACPVNAVNVMDRIEGAGLSWKAYMEGMPASCATSDAYPYVVKHNPFVYYNNIRNNAGRCQSHVVPYTQLSTDLQSASTTPTASWIVPDMCNDMHDCSIATGDAWLGAQLPSILGSPAFTTQNSLLLLMWDEDDFTGTNQVTLIGAGSPVKHGYVSSTRSDHYSILSTLEASWTLAALTSNDASRLPLSDFFGLSSVPPPVTACTGVSLTPLNASLAAGTAVTFSATATGCPSPQYRFWTRPPGAAWRVVQDYSTAATYSWNPAGAQSGTYGVEVDVRDVSQAISYDVVANTTLVLQPAGACKTPTLSAAPTSIGATGVAVSFTGGTSICPNPVYRFWIQDPGRSWSMVQDYSPATSTNWVQTGLQGSYNIEVDVRDTSSSEAYDAVANSKYVLNGCTGAVLAASPSNPGARGTTVTLTGTSTCLGTPAYKFWIRATNGSWQVVQWYSAATTFTWTPASAGTYYLEVDVRNQGGTDTYEKVANLVYTVT